MDATRLLTDTRASGVQLHITSLPGGRLGQPARDFVDWLVEAGQSVWQVLPGLDPRQAPLALQVAVGLRCVTGAARGAGRAGEPAGGRRLRRARGLLGRLVDVVRRRPRRPGAVRPRVVGAARLRPRARHQDPRRRPHLRRPGRRRRAGLAAVLPRRRRRRLPARRVCRDRPAWGNPLYRWDVCATTATAGGSSGCGGRSRCSTSCGSTTSAASRPTGPSRPATRPRWVGVGAGARARRVRRRPARRSARCRCSPRTSATSTSRSSSCARRSGFPGMAVLQFAFEPAYEYNTHDLANLEPDQVVYTGTHDNDTVCGWWWDLPDHRGELVRARLAARPGSAPTATTSRPGR